MDKIFDFMEDHPVASVVTAWVVGGVLSLIFLALGVAVVVWVLSMFGVV